MGEGSISAAPGSSHTKPSSCRIINEESIFRPCVWSSVTALPEGFTIHHRQVSPLLQLRATSAEKLIKDIQLEKHPEAEKLIPAQNLSACRGMTGQSVPGSLGRSWLGARFLWQGLCFVAQNFVVKKTGMEPSLVPPQLLSQSQDCSQPVELLIPAVPKPPQQPGPATAAARSS